MASAPDLAGIRQLLKEWLQRQLSPKGLEWLETKLSQLAADPSDRNLFLAFGAAPRFTGKDPLPLTPADLARADAARKGWMPALWTTDQAARILLILSLPHDDPEKFTRTLDQLFNAAEVNELTALYLSLPLLPHPERHRARTAEGIRTNMSVVFQAIALRNPYPAEYLDEAAWNQLVLKSIFNGTPLKPILGFDQRANDRLAHTLSDFAHERWAAKRPVPYELWRAVGPFLDEILLPDMERLFAQGTETEQRAAALACAQSTYEPARQLLQARRPDLAEKINRQELTWENLEG